MALTFANAYVEPLTKGKWREGGVLMWKPSLATNKKRCFILCASLPTPFFAVVHKMIKENVVYALIFLYTVFL